MLGGICEGECEGIEKDVKVLTRRECERDREDRVGTREGQS